MIEVEAKAKIFKPRAFIERARRLGIFKGRERKLDEYFSLESLRKYPKESLRIRKRKGFYEVNFKRRISYVKGVYAKKEVEFRVSDIKGFLSLIQNFGFKKWLIKEKESEIYELKKNFHIEINTVKGLGSFIEVEYLALPSEIKKAREEVLEVMSKLGIGENEIVKEGYTRMLWDKRH